MSVGVHGALVAIGKQLGKQSSYLVQVQPLDTAITSTASCGRTFMIFRAIRITPFLIFTRLMTFANLRRGTMEQSKPAA